MSSGAPAGAAIISSELGSVQPLTVNAPSSSTGGVIKPKSPLELERDLRRILSNEDKIAYLGRVGTSRVVKLLRVDCNAELLEAILEVLLAATGATPLKNTSETETENTSFSSSGEESNPRKGEVGAGTEKAKGLDVFSWLRSLSELEKFNFTARFFRKELMTNLYEWLISCGSESCDVVASRYRPE
jgi:Potential Monad-binding region of RPAP3